ncbi:MAG: xylose isomerase, partial [Acidobacteria bacterium]
MEETSRREFLKSSAAAAVVIGGSSFLSANSPKSLAIKKGIVYDMLPQTLSHVERFSLAREVGFEVVQAPTTSDERTAEEIKAAADKAGIRIDSVMNIDHWDYPLSSSDPAVVEKSLSGMRTSLQNAKLWGSDVVLLVPAVVNAQTS